MPVTRMKNDMWSITFYYTDASGKRKRHRKQPFKTRKEGLNYELEMIELFKNQKDQLQTKEQQKLKANIHVEIENHITNEVTNVNDESEKDNDSVDNDYEINENMKLNKYLSWWLSTYVECNNSYKEILRKEQIVRIQINPYLGNKSLNSIKPSDWDGVKKELISNDYTYRTINYVLGTLKKALKYAVENEILRYNPLQPVKGMPKVIGNDTWDWLKPEESEKFLKTIKLKYPQWHTYFLVLLRTGIRIGELSGLFWEDIDLEARELTIRRSLVLRKYNPPKSKKERIIPLTESVVTALKEHQMKTRMLQPVKIRILGKLQTGTHVFVDKNKMCHKHLATVIKKPLHSALRANGIRKIRPHDLRHTLASQLRLKGISIEDIQELLGHSDIKMTLRYAHISSEKKRVAVDVLEESKVDKRINSVVRQAAI